MSYTTDSTNGNYGGITSGDFFGQQHVPQSNKIRPEYTISPADWIKLTEGMKKRSPEDWKFDLPKGAIDDIKREINRVIEEYVKATILREDVVVKKIEIEDLGPVVVTISPVLDELKK